MTTQEILTLIERLEAEAADDSRRGAEYADAGDQLMSTFLTGRYDGRYAAVRALEAMIGVSPR